MFLSFYPNQRERCRASVWRRRAALGVVEERSRAGAFEQNSALALFAPARRVPQSRVEDPDDSGSAATPNACALQSLRLVPREPSAACPTAIPSVEIRNYA